YARGSALPSCRRRPVPLIPSGRRGLRAPLAAGKDADLDVPPTFLGIDLARIDLQLPIAGRCCERRRGGPLVPVGGRRRGGGMTQLTHAVVVQGPAGHLARANSALANDCWMPSRQAMRRAPAVT